jgi:hypothetical protein
VRRAGDAACQSGTSAINGGYNESMGAARKVSILATAGLLSIAVMLGWVSARPAMSASSASQLASASAYFDSIVVQARESRPRGARGDALTVSLGYLERLRLGMGSPFRLVDQAMHDPRLDPAMQQRVSWALLARLMRGDAYVLDPATLDGAGPWARDGRGATGTAHLALIERTIERASDPRAGELTVRLAYAIASADGHLSATSAAIAEQVAALVRDRALAERDLRDLLADANERHTDVLSLLVDRRALHAFRVEQPALTPLTSALRTEAMNDVPDIVAALDTLNRVDAPAPTNVARAPVLGAHFAARLTELGAEQPPLAPIVIAQRGQSSALSAATNEETLAGAFDAASWAADTTRRQQALSLLASAAAVRAFAQDTPWFVGMGGPAAADVTSEFGLARVDFARSVRAEWRPYYLSQIRAALRDMQSVFPAASFAGLRIAVGTAALPDSALAMHDPRTRTLELTVGGSGGTLAHELAHDIDWQTARRLFVAAGGYSTDRAVHERHGALASSVLGLSRSRAPRANAESGGTAPTDRPTELFARGTDWFTATALAMRGRSNGFLSAVQDVALPGYAAGAPTAGDAGVESLLSALDQMTYVPDSTRAAFRATWADAAAIDPLLVLRRVFTVPVSYRINVASPPFDLLPAPPLALCTVEDSPEGKARERLVLLAVEARARGMAERRAHSHRLGHSRWANAMRGVPPWDAAPASDYIRNAELAIVHSLRSVPSGDGVLATVPAAFASDNGRCQPLAR